MTIAILARLNTLEKHLIACLINHSVLSQVQHLSWPVFNEIVLQRRFLSLQITNVYELVIDALSDVDARYTVRKILHEEYPRSTKGIPLPSHRELLFQDLQNLGITRQKILTTTESSETKATRESVIQMLRQASHQEYCNVALVSALRLWAEVFVSIEYQCFWKKISERLTAKQSSEKSRSEFYYFHMLHDARGTNLGEETLIGGMTHSQELGLHIKRLLRSEAELQYCVRLSEQLFQLKSQFYDQFLPTPDSTL